MGDEFSFLTDSEDEIAVEDVLSQALDHSVLEQIAAINCSSFDNLPTHLENRFRKLKSLPTTTTTRFPPAKSKSIPYEDSHDSNSEIRKQKDLKSKTGNRSFKSLSDSSSSPPTESESESESGSLTPRRRTKSRSKLKYSSKTNSKMGKQKDLKSMSLSSSESESRSPSPPRGCLWCSAKKEKSVRSKQEKENRSTLGGNFNDIEFLKSISMKEQNKIMKQTMKEEEKINREADKIVKWAKQVSDRIMDVSGVDHLEDELSDDFENTK